MTTHDLDELFRFINGESFPQYDKGIHTYPKSADSRCKLIFEGCLELEKQGRIVRKIDEPDHVVWMPSDPVQ